MRTATPTITVRWPAFSIVSRVGAAILGSYVLAWGFTALGSMLLVRSGVARSEAVMSATMLAFVVYLIAALWAFAARRVGYVWLVLAGGGSLMTVLAYWLVGG